MYLYIYIYIAADDSQRQEASWKFSCFVFHISCFMFHIAFLFHTLYVIFHISNFLMLLMFPDSRAFA